LPDVFRCGKAVGAPRPPSALELLDPALKVLVEGMKSRWVADETQKHALVQQCAAMNFIP